MVAYVIAEVALRNDSWIEEYGQKLDPILKKHDGRYIARAPAEKLEGNRKLPNVLVMLEFPSLEKARAWYNDSDYAPLIKLRQEGSDVELTLVEGL